MHVFHHRAGLVLAASLTLPIMAADPPEPKVAWEKVGIVKGKLVKVDGATYIVQVVNRVPQVQGNRLQLKEVKTDYRFELTEDCKVRLHEPLAAFDDKGDIKKYTAAELAQLKGPDRSLPGYTGDVADLRPGMWLQVQAVRKKEYLRPGTARPKLAEAGTDRLTTNLIIVLADPAQPLQRR